MNPNTPEEIVEVVEAFMAGAILEKTHLQQEDWIEINESVMPTWNFEEFKYRVSPIATMLFVNIWKKTGDNELFYDVHVNQEKAVAKASKAADLEVVFLKVAMPFTNISQEKLNKLL
jgi:hypothetical protein